MPQTPPSCNLDLCAIAARILAGDAAAEDEISRFLEPHVNRALRRRIRDRDVARELANDVLMAVIGALRAGRLEDMRRIHGFVRGIVRNIVNGYLRARLARPREEPLPPDWAPRPTRHDDGRDGELEATRRGLAGLECGDREILIKTMVEGIRPVEVARELGLPPDVIRTRKSRALHRLIKSARRIYLRTDSSPAAYPRGRHRME